VILICQSRFKAGFEFKTRAGTL